MRTARQTAAVAATVVVMLLAGCSGQGEVVGSGEERGEPLAGTAGDGSDSAHPTHPAPPEPRVSLWADDDLTVVKDHCGEYIRAGTEYALRDDGVGVALPGWELAWWLNEAQLTRLGETAHEVTVGNWTAAYVNGAIPLRAALRWGDDCDPVVVITGQLRWDDGEPVVRDPGFGLRAPHVELADTETGRALRALLEEPADD